MAALRTDESFTLPRRNVYNNEDDKQNTSCKMIEHSFDHPRARKGKVAKAKGNVTAAVVEQAKQRGARSQRE